MLDRFRVACYPTEISSENVANPRHFPDADSYTREVRPTDLCCARSLPRKWVLRSEIRALKFGMNSLINMQRGLVLAQRLVWLLSFRIKGRKKLVRRKKIGIERSRCFGLEKGLIGMTSIQQFICQNEMTQG